MSKNILILLLILSPLSLQAQLPGEPGSPEFASEGRLMILRVVPKDKGAKLFFAGRKAADFDFKKDHKLLSVTAMRGEQKEVLQFEKQGDGYQVTNMPTWNEGYTLDVKSEVKGKVEEHNVKIKTSKP